MSRVGTLLRKNPFDAHVAWWIACVAAVVLLAVLAGCGYPAETKITPAESSVTNHIRRRVIEIDPTPPAPVAAHPTDVPATSVRKVWRVTWTEPQQ